MTDVPLSTDQYVEYAAEIDIHEYTQGCKGRCVPIYRAEYVQRLRTEIEQLRAHIKGYEECRNNKLGNP